MWVLESIFPRVILPAGQGSRQGDAYSQARAVRERLRRWRQGEYGELWDEALEAARLPPRSRRARAGVNEKTLQEKNTERAAKVTPQLQFGLQEVEKAALSFRRGSAPGPGGFRPEHLRITVKGAPANRAVRAGAALTRVVNLMAAGRVLEEVAPYLCGARLHAAKKDGELRPIAVGNLLRRLSSKLMATALVTLSLLSNLVMISIVFLL